MSNLTLISENYCSIANLKDYILTAYPNFLILGTPLKTVTGIRYEPKTYLKIRACNFEQWFNKLNLALNWFTSNEMDVFSETVIEEPEFKYAIKSVILNDKKQLKIEMSANGDQITFQFDEHEVKVFMLGIADLMLHVFCLPDNVMQILHHILSHFLCIPEISIQRICKKILNLDYASVLKLCKTCCEIYKIQGSVLLFTEFVLKHKQHLLIVYCITKKCVIPTLNLLQFI